MLKSCGVSLRTLGMRHLGFFLIESGGGVDEALFPRIGSVEFLRSLDVFAALFQGFVIGKIPELMKKCHGLAPVRDGAFGFAGGRVGKSLLGFLVLERVEERHTLFERGLHFRGATRREIHVAELIGRRGRQGIRPERGGWEGERNEEQPKG